MNTFQFKCDATETTHGTAYFQVEAETEAEALAMLVDDASEHYFDFKESYGGVSWDAKLPGDFEGM